MKKRKIIKSIEELHNPIEHIYGKTSCRECGQEYPCNTKKLISKKKK